MGVQIQGSSRFPMSSNSRCELDDDGASSDGEGLFGDVDEFVEVGRLATEGFMWASLCAMLILFSVSAAHVPHALVDRRSVRVTNVDNESHTVTMKSGSADCEIVVVVFLPDARWRETYLPQLELKFASAEQLAAWIAHF